MLLLAARIRTPPHQKPRKLQTRDTRTLLGLNQTSQSDLLFGTRQNITDGIWGSKYNVTIKRRLPELAMCKQATYDLARTVSLS